MRSVFHFSTFKNYMFVVQIQNIQGVLKMILPIKFFLIFAPK